MRETDLWVITLLLVMLVILTYGFSEVFHRLRPRVIYVHTGGKETVEESDAARSVVAS